MGGPKIIINIFLLLQTLTVNPGSKIITVKISNVTSPALYDAVPTSSQKLFMKLGIIWACAAGSSEVSLWWTYTTEKAIDPRSSFELRVSIEVMEAQQSESVDLCKTSVL